MGRICFVLIVGSVLGYLRTLSSRPRDQCVTSAAGVQVTSIPGSALPTARPTVRCRCKYGGRLDLYNRDCSHVSALEDDRVIILLYHLINRLQACMQRVSSLNAKCAERQTSQPDPTSTCTSSRTTIHWHLPGGEGPT
ncbi:hypothetical protein BC834DRAFT_417661 [Gloeopeniophorella convolvens]|nr:hypothetical protein BC834DRAFT_417661 [Gloeopeniophorella convolvens]